MQLSDELYAFPWQILNENNCNSYLIDGPFKILVDPGHQHLFAELQGSLEDLNIKSADINLIIGTHIHPDHIEAVESFSSLSTMTAIHEMEFDFLQETASYRYGFDLKPDFLLSEGTLKAGTTELEVIHAPGHSPGSVCLYWPSHKALFAGDVVFEQGVGRTDLPGGDGTQLKESIRHLSTLDIEFLLPGHGNIIRGKEAVARNFSLIKTAYFGFL